MQTTVNMREVSQVKVSSAVVQKEDMFCATQHGEEKQQINPSSANRFAFVKHERRPLILHKYVPLAQNYVDLFAKIELNIR